MESIVSEDSYQYSQLEVLYNLDQLSEIGFQSHRKVSSEIFLSHRKEQRKKPR
jgi:hypothetical protein